MYSCRKNVPQASPFLLYSIMRQSECSSVVDPCLESPSQGLRVWLGGRLPCLESCCEGVGVWHSYRAPMRPAASTIMTKNGKARKIVQLVKELVPSGLSYKFLQLENCGSCIQFMILQGEDQHEASGLMLWTKGKRNGSVCLGISKVHRSLKRQ